jgi:hypothetical protein
MSAYVAEKRPQEPTWTRSMDSDFKEEAIFPGPSFCISPPLVTNNSVEQHLFRLHPIKKLVEGLMWVATMKQK